MHNVGLFLEENHFLFHVVQHPTWCPTILESTRCGAVSLILALKSKLKCNCGLVKTADTVTREISSFMVTNVMICSNILLNHLGTNDVVVAVVWRMMAVLYLLWKELWETIVSQLTSMHVTAIQFQMRIDREWLFKRFLLQCWLMQTQVSQWWN